MHDGSHAIAWAAITSFIIRSLRGAGKTFNCIMKSIEQIANEFMAAYNSGNEVETSYRADVFARAIKRDEWQFRKVEHAYAIARAMYYLLRVNDRLSNDDSGAIVRLVYYCLLRNYSENSDVLSTDAKYADLIGGCELAFVVMCKSGQFLMYRILSGALGYLPNIAQKHVVDQMFLFGGIVKEANEKGYHYFLDSDISTRFNNLLQEVYENIPIGEELQKYKDDCTSVIKTIYKELEYGFSQDDIDLF